MVVQVYTEMTRVLGQIISKAHSLTFYTELPLIGQLLCISARFQGMNFVLQKPVCLECHKDV